MLDSLVIGGDSPIGKSLVKRLEANGESVRWTTRREQGQDKSVRLDLENSEALNDLPAAKKIFLVAAVTDFQTCEQQPQQTHVVNVDAPIAIARNALQNGSKVFFFSSVAVHSGFEPMVSERVDPTPNTEYGRQKSKAEKQLLSVADHQKQNLVILRPSKVVTADFKLFKNWHQALKTGQPIRAFDDLIASLVYVDDLIDVVIGLMTQKFGGIFHLSAEDQTTYYDLAQYLAHCSNADLSLVEAVSGREVLASQASWFPDYAVMDCSNTKKALGIDLPRTRSALDQFIVANRI